MGRHLRGSAESQTTVFVWDRDHTEAGLAARGLGGAGPPQAGLGSARSPRLGQRDIFRELIEIKTHRLAGGKNHARTPVPLGAPPTDPSPPGFPAGRRARPERPPMQTRQRTFVARYRGPTGRGRPGAGRRFNRVRASGMWLPRGGGAELGRRSPFTFLGKRDGYSRARHHRTNKGRPPPCSSTDFIRLKAGGFTPRGGGDLV